MRDITDEVSRNRRRAELLRKVEKAMDTASVAGRDTRIAIELYWDAEVRQCSGREHRRVEAVAALVALEAEAAEARRLLNEAALLDAS